MLGVQDRVSSREIITLLEKTKAVLAQYGWVRQTFGGRAMGFCLDGAMSFADSGHEHRQDRYSNTYYAATRLLDEATRGKDCCVRCWNDSQETVNPINVLLDKVIAQEKAKLN